MPNLKKILKRLASGAKDAALGAAALVGIARSVRDDIKRDAEARKQDPNTTAYEKNP